MAVIFGSDLRPGMTIDGHTIATVSRMIRGELFVRFTDNSQPRQFAWNQVVHGAR